MNTKIKLVANVVAFIVTFIFLIFILVVIDKALEPKEDVKQIKSRIEEVKKQKFDVEKEKAAQHKRMEKMLDAVEGLNK